MAGAVVAVLLVSLGVVVAGAAVDGPPARPAGASPVPAPTGADTQPPPVPPGRAPASPAGPLRTAAPTPPASGPGTASVGPPAAGDRLLLDGDVETGTLGQFGGSEAAGGSVEVVTQPVRAGRRAVRATLSRDDDGRDGNAWRAVVVDRHAGGPHGDTERWLGVSVYLPADWDVRTKGDGEVGILSIEQPPDSCDGRRKPPLMLAARDGRLEWTVRWAAAACMADGSAAEMEQLFSQPAVPGRWTDWVVHLRWSGGADGTVELWRDGVRVADRRGPVGYDDRGEAELRVGLEHRDDDPASWPAGLTRRQAYVDEIRMAGPAAGLADVSPR